MLPPADLMPHGHDVALMNLLRFFQYSAYFGCLPSFGHLPGWGASKIGQENPKNHSKSTQSNISKWQS
jgi:hypothetical protein